MKCYRKKTFNIMCIKWIVSLLLMFFISNSIAGKIYKWVDEKGSIHYSKNPPPEQFENEEVKVANLRIGDQACCYMVKSLISKMFYSGNLEHSKQFDSLFSSKNFNTTELNNFVAAKTRTKYSRSEISRLGYVKCMNSGFKFCRAPIDGKIHSKNKSSSGSGFIVSNDGYILTNEHVAGRCKKLKVQPQNLVAKLISKDSNFDLALLKVDQKFEKTAVFSIGTPLLGEEIIAAGFPYKQLLSSSIKITTGIVSSLAGIRDDKKVIQITAPIQPGNSGGPLIDKFGHIKGMIVSKLDSTFMLKYFKEIPQNVNFAIKPTYLKNFLNKNNISFKQKLAETELETTNISQQAESYTVEISCINNS